jgi:hypothetical protein
MKTGRRSTCESRRYIPPQSTTDSGLSFHSPSPSPYIHPPSSSPSPEAYPTSTSHNHTSTLIDAFIVANPLTLSGTGYDGRTDTPDSDTESEEHNSGSPPVSPRSASVSPRSVSPSLGGSPYQFDAGSDTEYSDSDSNSCSS